jgi:hypothetical protein
MAAGSRFSLHQKCAGAHFACRYIISLMREGSTLYTQPNCQKPKYKAISLLWCHG